VENQQTNDGTALVCTVCVCGVCVRCGVRCVWCVRCGVLWVCVYVVCGAVRVVRVVDGVRSGRVLCHVWFVCMWRVA